MSARLRDALIEMISISEAHIAGSSPPARQSNIERIPQAVASFPGLDIRVISPAGKMVIALAADQASEIMALLKTIHVLPRVYSNALSDPHRRGEALDEEMRDQAGPSHVY